jgi:branched-chain amino acid transport system substrate-binding protein
MFNRRSLMAASLAGLVALMGLASTNVACARESADPIKVGHYGSLTGAQATFGKSTSNGIRLAIKEFNAAGGLNGRQVELIEYDTKGEAREAGTAVTRLVASDKVVAVLGEVASSLSLAGGRVAQQYGVPMISPSSTNPAVTKIGNMVSRVCFTDDFQGYAAAKFAWENKKAKKVAVLFDQAAAYSKGLKDDFQKAFKDMGGEITTTQAFTQGDRDFTPQLTAIRETNPDILFVPGYYTDVGNIALQARKLGITVPMLGGDGWDSEELPKVAGDAIKGSYYVNHYSPDQPTPAVQEFVTKYKAEYGGATPDGLAALGYDAAKMLFDAMKRSASLSGKDLAAAINSTKDFPGVTGAITIDEGRNASKPAVIVEYAGSPLAPVFTASVDVKK